VAARWYPRARTAPSKPKPWYERGGGARFRRDDGIVRTHYPGLAWQIDAERRLARLEGTITIAEGGGITTAISTRVEFPHDYPASEPAGSETGGRFPWDQNRHVVTKTGQCCLWLPPLSKWDPEDPDALHTFLDELLLFFDRQLLFETLGRWVGPSWDHGPPAYWRFIVEQLGSEAAAYSFLGGLSTGRNDPCPCGSQRHYKHCHLSQFEMIARRIDPNELKRLREWRTRSAAGSHDFDQAPRTPINSATTRTAPSDSAGRIIGS